MERLVERFEENGKEFEAVSACKEHCLNGNCQSCHCKPMMEVRQKLFDYEDTGLTPKEVKAALRELEQYRELGTAEELNEAAYNASL